MMTHRGLPVRLDVVPAERFAAALFLTTGSDRLTCSSPVRAGRPRAACGWTAKASSDA